MVFQSTVMMEVSTIVEASSIDEALESAHERADLADCGNDPLVEWAIGKKLGDIQSGYAIIKLFERKIEV